MGFKPPKPIDPCKDWNQHIWELQPIKTNRDGSQEQKRICKRGYGTKETRTRASNKGSFTNWH